MSLTKEPCFTTRLFSFHELIYFLFIVPINVTYNQIYPFGGHTFGGHTNEHIPPTLGVLYQGEPVSILHIAS